jgi:hypothetical protein
MAYTPWSVIFGEQPTAAKWNELGANDASFNDGSGMAMDRCVLKRTAVQSINDATLTTIAWDDEIVDTNSMHNPASNNSRITIQKTGLYLVFAQAAYAANGTGRRFLNMIKNGAAIDTDLSDNRAATSAGEGRSSLLKVIPLVATNYIETQTLQNSGGALDLQAYSYFGAIQLVGSSS